MGRELTTAGRFIPPHTLVGDPLEVKPRWWPATCGWRRPWRLPRRRPRSRRGTDERAIQREHERPQGPSPPPQVSSAAGMAGPWAAPARSTARRARAPPPPPRAAATSRTGRGGAGRRGRRRRGGSSGSGKRTPEHEKDVGSGPHARGEGWRSACVRKKKRTEPQRSADTECDSVESMMKKLLEGVFTPSYLNLPNQNNLTNLLELV